MGTLEQIGVGAGTGKRNFPLGGHVIHDPVPFYMTFGKAVQIAMQFVLPATGGQWLFKDKSDDNIIDLAQILAAFFQQPQVFLNWLLKEKQSKGQSSSKSFHA